MTKLLTEALAKRKESLRAIAAATGVNHVSILRFLAGKQSLRLDLADRLAEYFGIECRQCEGKARRGGR
jgi:plasmid maintenance system antidote protein VapI